MGKDKAFGDPELPFVFIPDGEEVADEHSPFADSIRLRAWFTLGSGGRGSASSVPADERGVIPHEDLPPPPMAKPPPTPPRPPGFGEGEPIRRPGDWPHDPNDRM